MTWEAWVYTIASALLWLFLATLGVAAWRPGFVEWLQGHPRLQMVLLGIDRLPSDPVRVLKRFYGFLAAGWTWILLWSWFLMPLLRTWFFRGVNGPRSFQLAQIATLIVVVAYAATGFFSIGKAVSIWYREIYARPQ